MKKMYPIFKSALFLFFLSIGLSASAQTYTQLAPADTQYNYNDTLKFVFSSASIGAYGNASITVIFNGDFGDGSEYLDIIGEDGITYLGSSTNYSSGLDCDGVDSSVFTFNASVLNTWAGDGSILLHAVPSLNVDPYLCGTPNEATLRLTYQYCLGGIPQQPFVTWTDSVFCAYDGPQFLAGSPTGGVFSGTGVINGSILNPALGSPGNNTIIYTIVDLGCTVSVASSYRILPGPAITDINVCPGDTFVLDPAGNRVFTFFSDPALTNVLDSGITAEFSGLYNSQTYYVASFDSITSFEITSLATTNGHAEDFYNVMFGDDRGGIAVSDSFVFVVDDYGTVRYDLDLTPGSATAFFDVMDGIFSDLANGDLYTLWNGIEDPDYNFYNFPFTVTELKELNNDLIPQSNSVTLSSPIVVSNNFSQNGIFPGAGFLILYNGNDGHYYVIKIPSGEVTDLGAGLMPSFYYSENWSDWGVGEFNGTDYSILYRSYLGAAQVNRINITTGVETVVSNFTDLSDMASFTYAPWKNRWYFHHEYSGQFGGFDETVGYADGSHTSSVLQAGYGCYTEVDVTINQISLGADTNLCAGNDVILFAGTDYESYTWNGVNNNYNYIIVDTSNTYVVEAIDDFGCLVTDTIVVTFDACLGNENQTEVLNSLVVFPNPADEFVNIQLNYPYEDEITLRVLDVTGRLILVQSIQGNKGPVNVSTNVSALAPGTYFFEFESENFDAVRTIIKK